ncbi:MAG: ATP-binding protein [Candidatus Tectomicrobia bacterium]|nr:ATP-binding protein [Candidatus Tectomicrobia bacterium]
MTLNFLKAEKSSSFLRLALCGGPGAGKTWTSLALASGLGHHIALLDTERGSARKYAGDFDFDVCELESHHPQQYIDGMVAGDPSLELKSSEQFVWLHRRYGETKTQLSRWAITPSIRADSSQDEGI